MSQLRKQLEQSRDGYRRIRYDGDLGEDVLPAPAKGGTRGWRWIGTLVGVAATVAVVLQRSGHRLPVGTDAPQSGLSSRQLEDAYTQAASGSDDDHDDDQPVLWNSFVSVPSMFDESDGTEWLVPSFPSLSELTDPTETDTTMED